jgi:hypothetical protein
MVVCVRFCYAHTSIQNDTANWQVCKVLVDRNIKIKKLEQTLNNILTKR